MRENLIASIENLRQWLIYGLKTKTFWLFFKKFEKWCNMIGQEPFSKNSKNQNITGFTKLEAKKHGQT